MSFQTDFIRLRLTPVTVILFLTSLCSIASQLMKNWVQIGLEIPKSYSYSIPLDVLNQLNTDRRIARGM